MNIIETGMLPEIESEIRGEISTLRNLAVSPSTIKPCEAERAKANKMAKDYEMRLEDAKKAVISKVMGDFDAKVSGLIGELKESAKEFSATVLDTKKQIYKENCRAMFDEMNDGGTDGQIFDFDEVYEESWYSKTGQSFEKTRVEMIFKFRRLRAKGTEEVRTYVIRAKSEQFASLEERLDILGMQYERK